MKRIWTILLLSFIGGLVWAQVSPSPAPTIIGAVSADAPQWLIALISKFPKISILIFIVGGLRLTLKPLFAFGHQFFQAWGLVSFDQVETNIEQSKFFKSLYFVLDYLGSIKMPVAAATPADQTPTPTPPKSA